MVPSIARQSVIIKCNAEKSVLLGNYEFYYAAGFLKKLYGLTADADMEPAALHEAVAEQIAALAPEDARERYLIRIFQAYDPDPAQDEQMRELFHMGESELYPWVMNVSGG